MKKFWLKPLEKLTSDEWEKICCRCGKCCVQKFSLGPIMFFTNNKCKDLALDDDCNVICNCYKSRLKKGDCVKVDLQLVRNKFCNLLPDDCAYRILDRGEKLPSWHPLISGIPNNAYLCKKTVFNK